LDKEYLISKGKGVDWVAQMATVPVLLLWYSVTRLPCPAKRMKKKRSTVFASLFSKLNYRI
jgi:hypothetical protein